MPERVDNWLACLAEAVSSDHIIKQHSCAGRPLGNTQFIENPEKLLKCDLSLKKPGRMPMKEN